MIFKNNIKKLREESGLSIDDLSIATGIRRFDVVGLESLIRNPSLHESYLIGRALNKTPFELIDFDQEVKQASNDIDKLCRENGVVYSSLISTKEFREKYQNNS